MFGGFVRSVFCGSSVWLGSVLVTVAGRAVVPAVQGCASADVGEWR